MKTSRLYSHLRKDKNFINGTCLFNMCPEGQKEVFDGKFWIIELFDLNFPLRKIGVMIWDGLEAKLYGPCVLKNVDLKPKSMKGVILTQGGKEGVPADLPIENTLNGWKFIKTSKGVELYLYFDGQIDYCISGFEENKVVFKEV